VLNVHSQVGESFNCAIIPKKDRRDVCNGRCTDGHCLVLGFWSRWQLCYSVPEFPNARICFD
jgi:hypothetical protein